MTTTQTRPPRPATRPTRSTAPASAVSRLLTELPLGNRLDDDAFQARHRLAQLVSVGLLGTLVLLNLGVEFDVGHLVLELSPMVIAMAIAHHARNHTMQALASSAALMIACAALVHVTNGLIESHFLFFVLLPLIALYQDIKAFLLAIGFVVFHHAVIGMVVPEAVYNHPAAVANPLKYGALHATYVVGLVIVLIVEWSFSERAQNLAESRLRELQETQSDLVHAQKLESVGQLAAGIAHEINTPMQYIGDNTHFLKNSVDRLLAVAEAADAASQPEADDDAMEQLRTLIAKSKLPMIAERAPKAAEDALSGVENVSRIVTAMKRFSHPGAAEKQPVDLNESIMTTMTVCRNEWKYAADIVTDFGDIPTVHGHLGELNQVWLNMIVNAAHALAERHGDAKGKITIRTCTTRNDEQVQVSISDNGAGIPKENIDKVLDPFFTTKAVGRGTGQGLSIAHQVITKVHHGSISVVSEVGVGTTFTITLPVHPQTDENGVAA